MRTIDRKVVRDLLRMRAQLFAIALVLGCGTAIFLGMRTTLRTLEAARAEYYARERFPDVFAPLVRAPEHVAAALRAIPGVARVETRVVADVLLDVEGSPEAVTGRLVSIPDRGEPEVGALRLRSGRPPEPGNLREALVHEGFAGAHGLVPGDRLVALIDGKRTELEVVGTALSPEFTWTIGPGQILPDDRRFGVLWLGREALAHAFDMDGAFNEALLQVGRGVDARRVIADVDRILEPHGGIGAYARADQVSEAFVRNELEQLRTFGMLVPSMFLAVAAFLLHVVVGRIVSGQREQIAALKAVGYRDREVGVHYAKLVLLVVAAGCVLGTAGGTWLGSLMCDLYAVYYRFPELRFRIPPSELVASFGAALVAALFGTAAAIRRTIRLPPAEAMRPPAPPVYRRTFVERLRLTRLLPPSGRIVLRELERSPGRAVMSVIGIALAGALIVVSSFLFGGVRRAMNIQFGLQQRADVTLALTDPRAIAARTELEHLPGVLYAEPVRSVPVRLRHGRGSDDIALTGLLADARLEAVLDVELEDVRPTGDGLVLTRKLAEKLGVAPGDRVTVEVREGRRHVTDVTVARVAETFLGMGAYLELGALCRLLGETPTMNRAHLLVDESRLLELHAAVKETPIVAGIAERDSTIRSFRRMVDENLGTSIAINLGFSLVMALGVLYNAARITLEERARDLASLRVLGFRRREVTAILLGEIALLTAVAIPLGLGLGYLGAIWVMRTLDTEEVRFPFVVEPWTYALAALTVLGAAAIASFQVWRRLERIDLVAVLKTRD